MPSTKGQVIKICECHYDKVKHWKWSASLHSRKGAPEKYIPFRMQVIDGKQVGILMNRFVLDAKPGEKVDHIDGNSMNNACDNLRLATQSQNNLNQKGAKHNSKSGYKGVYWHKGAQKWAAEVVYDHKKYYLGLFEDVKEAGKTYNAKALELDPEFAYLNDIEPKGLVGTLYGITIAHQSNVGDPRVHTDDPEKCWC